MQVEQFQGLLAKHTVTTSNVRALRTKWYSGVSRIPDEITSKMGSIVSLLQDEITKGRFCRGEDQYLLIYNFQPLQVERGDYLCSLDMVIRPISELGDLDNCTGEPFQLVVNGTTGAVGNSAYGYRMIAAGLEEEGEESEEEEESEMPLIYGNYKDYSDPIDFLNEVSTLLETIRTFREAGTRADESAALNPAVCFSFSNTSRKQSGTFCEPHLQPVCALKEHVTSQEAIGEGVQRLRAVNA